VDPVGDRRGVNRSDSLRNNRRDGFDDRGGVIRRCNGVSSVKAAGTGKAEEADESDELEKKNYN
jgi:hypothetical protein